MAAPANQVVSSRMTPERWQRIRELFHATVERNADERAAYLARACAADPSLRADVEKLISSHEQAASFLERTEATPPAAESSPILQPGQLVGHYRIIEPIGQGGMGVVYKAEDSRLGRLVALKFLPSTWVDDPQALERFQREARAASALNHPHVCTIYAIEEDEGRPFIVMELLTGQTLSACIAGEPLAPPRLIELSVQIADGLQAAHERGITHRDIKPGNIFVTDKGQAKILDFGLARMMAADGWQAARDHLLSRPEAEGAGDGYQSSNPAAADASSPFLTKPGRGMGTLPYISPEQLRGEPPDARSDLFSFGTVLYEMATGEPAFAGSQETMAETILTQEPPSLLLSNPDLPAELERIITKALEKNRELRYQSASDIKADLLRIEAAGLRGEASTALGKWHPVRLWASATALVLVLAAGVAAVLWKAGTLRSTPVTPLQVRSMAVLPFENLSHDPQQEYFADGMTAELITNISQIRSLRVIARSSTMKYKSGPRSIREIAKDFNVDAVLEGTVLQSGDRVRIDTQLVDARSERTIWAQSYEDALGDALALQNRIARTVIAAIRVKLTPPEEQRLATVQPVNPDAYLAYLRGVFYFQKGFKTEDNEAAIREFERAVSLDNEFASAHAYLASTYAYSSFLNPSPEVAAKAFAAANTSLSLNPNLAEGYLARGMVAGMALRLPGETGAEDFRRALALNPNLSEAHFQLGGNYLHRGLLDEALSEFKAVLALDPHRLNARFYLARVYLYQQRYDEALRVYEQSPDFTPNLLWEKVLILFYRRERTAAHELVRELQAKLPESADMASVHAVLLAAEGKNEEAEEQIRLATRTRAPGPHFHHAEYNIASAYALMGDHREALHWLRKTAEDRLTPYPLFERDPNLNNLRDNPDFKAWLGEMKSLWERRRASL
jgi:serine/threonine protein kinase/Tfp pilus assembly protein PilF